MYIYIQARCSSIHLLPTNRKSFLDTLPILLRKSAASWRSCSHVVLCVCVCVCVCVCARARMYTYIHICAYVHVHMCICIYVYMYIHVYTCIFMYICILAFLLARDPIHPYVFYCYCCHHHHHLPENVASALVVIAFCGREERGKFGNHLFFYFIFFIFYILFLCFCKQAK
jgi:hypothetical protein